jgi:hypothetical protein
MESGNPGASRQARDNRWPITDAGGFDNPGLEHGADQRGAQIWLSHLQLLTGVEDGQTRRGSCPARGSINLPGGNDYCILARFDAVTVYVKGRGKLGKGDGMDGRILRMHDGVLFDHCGFDHFAHLDQMAGFVRGEFEAECPRVNNSEEGAAIGDIDRDMAKPGYLDRSVE